MNLGLTLGLGARALGGEFIPPGYDVIVLPGQSNQIGRYGPIDPVLDATDGDIFQYGFNAQTVAPAADPLDHDGETANTIGPGLTFAKTYKANHLAPGRQILLVPVARGGQPISYWAPGSAPSNAVIASVNAAMAAGSGVNRLVVVNFQHGESDAGRSQAAYAADLDALIAHWRASFTGGANVPFIVGDMLPGGTSTTAAISAALADTPSRVTRSAFVASTGLVSGGDNLHFDAASLRTLGTRYHAAFTTLVPITPRAPGQVTGLAATPANAQVALTWTAPPFYGNAITDYVVQYRVTGSPTWLTFADGTSSSTSATVTGLTNGTGYDFRVAGVNSVGTGTFSATVTATPTSVAFPINLATGTFAAIFDPQNTGSMYQTTDTSTPSAINSAVGRLEDLDGGTAFTQGTAGSRPILRQSGALNFLEYDGTDDHLLRAETSTFFDDSAMTMVYAIRGTPALNARVFAVGLSSSANLNFSVAAGTSPNPNLFFRSGTNATILNQTPAITVFDGNWQVLTVQIDATTTRVRVNRGAWTNYGVGFSSGAWGSANRVALGALVRNTIGSYADFDMSRVFVASVYLSDTNLAAVEDWAASPSGVVLP